MTVLGVDTFTRADNPATLGNSEGTGTPAWQSIAGAVFGVLGNQARWYSGNNKVYLSLGVSDGYWEVEMTAGLVNVDGAMAPTVRITDDSNFISVRVLAGPTYGLYKLAAGVLTLVASAGTPAEGDLIGILVSGTSFSVYQNRAQIIAPQTISDATLQGVNNWGIRVGRADARFAKVTLYDAFPSYVRTASDSIVLSDAAGAVLVPVPQAQRRRVGTAGRYRAILRASDRSRIGILEEWKKLQIVKRFNDVGTFLLEGLAPAGPYFSEVVEGTGLIIQRALPGEPFTDFASGQITSIRRRYGQGINQTDVGGVTDDFVLRDGMAHPSPADFNEATQAYDSRSGVASTVMLAYVNANIGPGAYNGSVDRRVSGLTMAADPLVGTSVLEKARFGILLELLQKLAIAGGDLGFRVDQVGAGLVFSVYEPSDRSATVKLSVPLGNLREFDYTIQAPTGTYVIAAGGGDLTARAISKDGDATAESLWGRRIEKFTDARDTTDATLLAQRRDEEITNGRQQNALSLVPVAAANIVYGVDYDLGDTITGVVDAVSVVQVVREVTIDVGVDSEKVSPLLASPGATNPRFPALASRVRSIDGRLLHQERTK